jgi:GT2 family glycosyltransferase
MRFSVVIPTRGRPELLRETLESIARCNPAPEEVLVVDGDPARSAERIVGETLPRARYLASEPGLTRQRNAALAVCTGDVVVFIDDDVDLDSSIFVHLAEVYRDPSVIGATGRVIEPASRRFGHKHAPIRRLLLAGGPPGSFTRFGYPRYVLDVDRDLDVQVMQGCFMSARREAALAVGFDEGLPGYGLAEDEDFSYRLSRRGRIRYVPQAVLEHKKTGFSEHDPRALGRVAVRNRAYLFRKNFRRTPLARAQFAFLLLLLLGQRLVNREWAGARGLLEGAVDAWRERK